MPKNPPQRRAFPAGNTSYHALYNDDDLALDAKFYTDDYENNKLIIKLINAKTGTHKLCGVVPLANAGDGSAFYNSTNPYYYQDSDFQSHEKFLIHITNQERQDNSTDIQLRNPLTIGMKLIFLFDTHINGCPRSGNLLGEIDPNNPDDKDGSIIIGT